MTLYLPKSTFCRVPFKIPSKAYTLNPKPNKTEGYGSLRLRAAGDETGLGFSAKASRLKDWNPKPSTLNL